MPACLCLPYPPTTYCLPYCPLHAMPAPFTHTQVEFTTCPSLPHFIPRQDWWPHSPLACLLPAPHPHHPLLPLSTGGRTLPLGGWDWWEERGRMEGGCCPLAPYIPAHSPPHTHTPDLPACLPALPMSAALAGRRRGTSARPGSAPFPGEGLILWVLLSATLCAPHIPRLVACCPCLLTCLAIILTTCALALCPYFTMPSCGSFLPCVLDVASCYLHIPLPLG